MAERGSFWGAETNLFIKTNINNFLTRNMSAFFFRYYLWWKQKWNMFALKYRKHAQYKQI